MDVNEYDLVVIGSGPAGQKSAICAAKLRKKVAIIDRKKTIGGVCVHTGTIPSKTLREAVLYLSGFRQRSFYGRNYVLKDRIAMSDLVFRAQAVMAREIEVITAQLRRNQVTTFEGNARFLDPHTVEVKSEDGSQLLRGHYIMIACGTRPAHSVDISMDGKRIFDSDRGPNTGGMGSYSPVAEIDQARAWELAGTVHQPVIAELARRGSPFHGVLYAGLMLTAEGPKVLEFNARFGDPETQAILPRLRSDLLELMERATATGGLDGAVLDWSPDTAVTVVLASRGYPESSSSGELIHGLDRVPPDVHVTHAGTSRNAEGQLVTAGGRVLNVTALGPDADTARAAAYAAADMIQFDGRQLRRDIALQAVRR